MESSRTPVVTPWHTLVLTVLAVIGLVVPALSGPFVLQVFVNVLVGSGMTLTLVHFARARHLRARRELESEPSGRIRERQGGSRWVFDLPGAGIEPWGADAWVVGVIALVTLWMSLAGEPLARPLGFMLVLLAVALGLRLAAVKMDHIRLELRREGWWVEACEGGRVIKRNGPGILVPELLPESLVLWSGEGRVGVLRGELEPEERAWLAGRLERFRSEASEPANAEVS